MDNESKTIETLIARITLQAETIGRLMERNEQLRAENKQLREQS